MQAQHQQIEEWIAAVALGDRRSFDALYGATSGKLFAICLHVLNDRAEAEETLQEVYLRIWHGAGRYASNGLSPMTWLITIARNRSIDHLRARGPAQDGNETLMGLRDPGPSAEARLVARGEAGRISGCLDRLDPPRGVAVRAAYLEGLSYADLALRHDVPLNTMKSWLRRSLLSLKDCLTA